MKILCTFWRNKFMNVLKQSIRIKNWIQYIYCFIAELPYKFVKCALNWVWNILSVMIWDMKLWFHLNIQNWCVNWDGSSKVYQTLPIIQLCYMNLYFTSQNKAKLFSFFRFPFLKKSLPKIWYRSRWCDEMMMMIWFGLKRKNQFTLKQNYTNSFLPLTGGGAAVAYIILLLYQILKQILFLDILKQRPLG